ncbi:hypothetical protein ACO1O0_002519 [Amphichorda felina]
MDTFPIYDPSDTSAYFESGRKIWSTTFGEDLYETIIRIPLRSPYCSPSSYPLTNPIRDTSPYPSEDWLKAAGEDPIFLQDAETDMSQAASAKLTLMRDVFWPWLRALVTVRQDSQGTFDSPWKEKDLLGMLNWYRLAFHLPMQASVASAREPCDGVWRLMLLSSPWGRCEHFDDLLFSGEEPTPDMTGRREHMVFSMEQLARCRRQAFRGMRHPFSAGMEHEAMGRLVRVANAGDFGVNADPWCVYVKHWGPEPYSGTVEEVLGRRAEWMARGREEEASSEQELCDLV